VCFRDPESARTFTVDSGVPVTQWPLAYWQPDSGPRLYTRRVLLATNVTREFALQWTTPEQDWSRNVALEQRIVSSFDTR
jgi:hypothetical protein